MEVIAEEPYSPHKHTALYTSLEIRVNNQNMFFLFLSQNIVVGTQKTGSKRWFFLAPMFKLMDKKMTASQIFVYLEA